MRMLKLIPIVVLIVAAGCASRPKPIVDMKGVDPAKYEADLADCQKYADQGVGAGGGAVAGAAIGAGVGYVAGRAVGARDPSAIGRGGAVVGGAKGAAGGAHNRHSIVSKCMSGRGYRVLN
jgi:outer membrane lipoprotein SlyB